MLPALFLLLLLLPVAELWVILQVSDGIGLVSTLVLLIGVSIAGSWLLKREGVATWRRLQASLRTGKVPAKEVTDGALILLGGALLVTPGFISDAVGLVFVLPPTRALVKAAFTRFMRTLALRRMGAAGYASHMGKRIYEARVTKARVRRSPPPRPSSPAARSLPSDQAHGDETAG